MNKVQDSAAMEERMSRSNEEEKASQRSARDHNSGEASMMENNPIENMQNEMASDNNDETKEEDDEDAKPKKCNWVGWIIRIAIILGLAALALWAIFDSSRLTGIFEDFIDWMEDNPILAPFVFIIVYVFATVFFLPGLILTLGAGFAFNEAYGNAGVAILVGSIVVWTGAMIGSILAMLIGRYLLRDWVGKKANQFKVFGAIDTAIEKEGFKLTLLLRLSPAIPFNLFNYLMGITKVPLAKYAMGGIGMIPGTIVFVYFGTTVSNISDAARGNFDGGVLQLVLLIGGSILAVVAVFYVSFVARKEIKKVLDKTEEEKKQAENDNSGMKKDNEGGEEDIENLDSQAAGNQRESGSTEMKGANLEVGPTDNIPDAMRAESIV